MRDVERLREKIEFSLETRQVWVLSLCAVLLFGVVFAIGVTIGRNAAPATPPAPSDLAALDAAAREKQPAATVAQKQEKQPPVAATQREEQTAAAVPQRPDRQQPAASERRAAPDAEAAPARAPSSAPATVVEPPPRPLEIAAATPVALTPAPRDVGDFTIQIGASQDRAEAQRMEAKARSKGLKPYVVEADLGRKGTWYRVRVGAFKDKDAASKYRQDVERELRASAVVMPSR